MLLTKLKIKNFKCHEDLTIADIQNLCILIGENDAGKTVVLDAIDHLLSAKNCTSDELRAFGNDCEADTVDIIGSFKLSQLDSLPEHLRENNSRFVLTKRMSKSAVTFYVRRLGFTDEEFNNFPSFSVSEKREMLTKHGLKPGRTHAELNEEFEKLVQEKNITKIITETPINFNEIRNFIPRVEKFSSGDYTDPSSLIQRNLKVVAQQALKSKDIETGQISDISEIEPIKRIISRALNKEIRKAEATVKSVVEGFGSFSIDPVIDFNNIPIHIQLKITTSNGSGNSRQFGQGMNRRLWLGLLDWQKQIERDNNSNGIINLYDEPETNLHYRAQQQIFQHIIDRSSVTNNAQSFVCTHSVPLIDRAPADSVYLLQGSGDEQRVIHTIQGGTDVDLRTFYDKIGRSLGLTNTAILYEKAFLLVEGHSEEEALPILYKRIYGNSFAEDGILVINLETCSAWKSVISVLLRNRTDYIHMLLDSDCIAPNSSARLTPERFVEAGCNTTFLANQITFIGTKEYEDSFSTTSIVQALNESYNRIDGLDWTEAEIDNLRTSTKFSEALKSHVLPLTVPTERYNVSKVKIASALAESCPLEDVPTQILHVFSWLRRCAGIEQDVPLSPEIEMLLGLPAGTSLVDNTLLEFPDDSDFTGA